MILLYKHIFEPNKDFVFNILLTVVVIGAIIEFDKTLVFTPTSILSMAFAGVIAGCCALVLLVAAVVTVFLLLKSRYFQVRKFCTLKNYSHFTK